MTISLDDEAEAYKLAQSDDQDKTNLTVTARITVHTRPIIYIGVDGLYFEFAVKA